MAHDIVGYYSSFMLTSNIGLNTLFMYIFHHFAIFEGARLVDNAKRSSNNFEFDSSSHG